MANPRRKHSKSRTRKRRSVYYGSLKRTIGESQKPRQRIQAVQEREDAISSSSSSRSSDR